MPASRRLLLAFAIAASVILAAVASAGANAGGTPPGPSCGIGRTEAHFLIALPVRPGASEASLEPPSASGCTGR